MIYIIFLTYLFLINVRYETVAFSTGSHELFITEIVRVKRQAGYVYKTPNIPFDLPTQIPMVSTQAQNVDRTQAQHMFYAYPAPASGGTKNTGHTASEQTTATNNNSGTSGYNYEAQSVETGGAQTTGQIQNQHTAISQGAIGSSGYGYNAPGIINSSGQSRNSGEAKSPSSSSSTATSSVSSTYRYDMPSSGLQVEDKSESSDSIKTNIQQNNSGTSQSITGPLPSGYDYAGPSSGTTLTETGLSTSQLSGATSSGYSSSVSESSGTNAAQGATGNRSSQSANTSINSSYRFEIPVSSNTGQSSTTLGSSQSFTQGYHYNDHNVGQTSSDVSHISTNTGTIQGTNDSDVTGYNINAPSRLALNGQTRSSTTPQTSSSSSTATSSVTTSYRYESPRQIESNQSFDISANGPQYLPPIIQGSIEVNNRGSSGTTITSAGPPSGSYVPPAPGPTRPRPTDLSQTYILPTSNAETATSKPSPLYATSPVSLSEPSSHGLSSSFYGSKSIQQSNPTIIQPSNSYVPPPVSQPSGFVTAEPSSSYIPSPHTADSQTTVTKPGKSYLLPQGSRKPAAQRSTVSQPSQSYITPSNSGTNYQSINSLLTTNGYSGSTAALTPNSNYLPPNNVSKISDANDAISSQNNNYLPPKQGSSIQQGAVSNPADSYLPPVF